MATGGTGGSSLVFWVLWCHCIETARPKHYTITQLSTMEMKLLLPKSRTAFISKPSNHVTDLLQSVQNWGISEIWILDLLSDLWYLDTRPTWHFVYWIYVELRKIKDDILVGLLKSVTDLLGEHYHLYNRGKRNKMGRLFEQGNVKKTMLKQSSVWSRRNINS